MVSMDELRGRTADVLSPFLVAQKAHCLRREVIRSVADQDIPLGHGVDPRHARTCGDDRDAGGHRLEDLVLDASREAERRHESRRLLEVAGHVTHPASDSDARNARQAANLPRRALTDDDKLGVRDSGAHDWPDVPYE